MNAALIEALNRAASLELFHLSTILERLMSDPARIIEIRRHLHLGQSVRFLDWQQAGAQMPLRTWRIVAMKDTQLTVQDEHTRREWKTDLDRYAALHAQAYGEAVDAEKLIPHMLEAFMAGDRGFLRGRKPIEQESTGHGHSNQ